MATTREIWVGESANLSSLRAAIRMNSAEIALNQLLDSSVQERVLCRIDSVIVNCSSSSGGYLDDNDDDNDDDNNNENTVSLLASFFSSQQQQQQQLQEDRLDGPQLQHVVVITTERILFCGLHDVHQDFSVDAGCVNLHALSNNEPSLCCSVFLQVENDDSGDEPVDITLIPSDESNCQIIFDALTQLVALHPILPDDEDDDDDDIFADDHLVMMTMPAQTPDDADFEDDHDDDDGASLEDEREAMLRRLDNLLLVPPEFDYSDDQFEDADEALL